MHSADFYQKVAINNALALTLPEIKDWLKIDGVDSSEDALLQAMSWGVQNFFEKYTNQVLFNTQFKYQVNRLRRHIELRKGNVASLDSITYLDVNQVVQTVDPSTYFLITQAGYPELDFPWQFVFPSEYGRPQAVTILFTAGYTQKDPTAIPHDIKMAMKAHLLNWHENRGDSDDAEDALPRVTKILYDQMKVMSLVGGTYR